MPNHPSHRVRAFLREDLPRWRVEGIIDGNAERLLAQRYGPGERASAGLALAALHVLATSAGWRCAMDCRAAWARGGVN